MCTPAQGARPPLTAGTTQGTTIGPLHLLTTLSGRGDHQPGPGDSRISPADLVSFPELHTLTTSSTSLRLCTQFYSGLSF